LSIAVKWVYAYVVSDRLVLLSVHVTYFTGNMVSHVAYTYMNSFVSEQDRRLQAKVHLSDYF